MERGYCITPCDKSRIDVVPCSVALSREKHRIRRFSLSSSVNVITNMAEILQMANNSLSAKSVVQERDSADGSPSQN